MDMAMNNRTPEWLTPLSWVILATAVASALVIAIDIYAGRRRHRAITSELVWVTSALYLGPFALPLYFRSGRLPQAHGTADSVAVSTGEVGTVAALPGGGASAIAHLVGVPLVIASGLTIAGINLWVMIIVIGALAMVLLYLYERGEATGHSRPISTATAVTAAVLTVLAFDIGMGGWMLLLHFNEFMPPATDAAFWFLMQVGIILGLLTGYPVVRWLTRRQQSVVPA